jgi:hypothetical protein
MKAVLIIFIATTLLSSCRPTEKAASLAPKATSELNTDNWQRSKECAAQAEKLMTEWHNLTDAPPKDGGIAPSWTDHYSPKYNRCFIKYTHTINEGWTSSMVLEDMLIDAFERSTLAKSFPLAAPAQIKLFCSTDDDPKADCEKAKNFISDHMKN